MIKTCTTAFVSSAGRTITLLLAVTILIVLGRQTESVPASSNISVISINEGPMCATTQHTYDSIGALEQANETVLHCGECGQCSTVHDIGIYRDTNQTLTATARGCAIQQLLLGQSFGRACLERHVGFTSPCAVCWIENFTCTIARCAAVCFGYYTLGLGTWEDQLNPCFACDERQCGPTFVACAGANRRRSGIVSDIPRLEGEVCTHTLP